MDRFNLEEAITECFTTSTDLNLISETVLEDDLSKDDLANALIGLSKLHEMRCQKVFKIFEQMLYEGLIKNNLE
jgi:hypothetical protein